MPDFLWPQPQGVRLDRVPHYKLYNLLVVRRESGIILYRDYMRVIFPSSLLTTSKIEPWEDSFEHHAFSWFTGVHETPKERFNISGSDGNSIGDL